MLIGQSEDDMTIKVYLAGGWFENKDDWRYGLVKGIEASPITKDGEYSPENWGTLENAILGCIDYVGPYPNDETGDGPDFSLYLRAIKRADIVFAWLEDSENFDAQKVCTEIAYAGGLGKFVGMGSSRDELQAHQDTWFAAYIGCAYPYSFYADSPKESFIECLSTLFKFLPLPQRVEFSKLRNSHLILEDDYTKAGYVYLIRADTGHYKIGRSNNVPKRMNLFAVKLPFKFDLIHYFPCQNMYQAEAELHRVFKDKRTNGEWFSLGTQEETFIKSITEWSTMGSFEYTGEFPEVEAALWDSVL